MKEVKKLKVRRQPMASRKRFPNNCAFDETNGTETLLCDGIVVLNIAAGFCVSESFVRNGLDLNTNLILLAKWPMSSPVVRRAL